MGLDRFLKRVLVGYRFETRKYNKNQLLFILDAVLINASLILTMGFFISGYIVWLGGSDFITGIINSSINWAAIASLFSFIVYENLRRRKSFLVVLVCVSRILVCTSVFTPFFFGHTALALYTAAGMIIAGNIIWGIYAVGWMVWITGVSPSKTRNDFFYNRMLLLRISFTTATIVMGVLLDFFNKSHAGFIIVFCASLLLAVADVFILIRIEEPEKNLPISQKFNILLLKEPLRNRDYKKYLVFILLFYVSYTMASSFSPLYLIKYLNFDYSFISLSNILMYISMIVFTRYWRRIECKRGMRYVFLITGILASSELLVYSMLIKERYYLLLAAPIISGMGFSGFNICIINSRYNLMPEENRTVYEGWFNAVFGLGTLIAPVLGGILLDKLAIANNVLFKHGNFQLLYLLSFVLSITTILLFFGRNSASLREEYLCKVTK